MLELVWYAFYLLIATVFIALVWDYAKIFLSQWRFSKGLPDSNLSEISENSPVEGRSSKGDTMSKLNV